MTTTVPAPRAAARLVGASGRWVRGHRRGSVTLALAAVVTAGWWWSHPTAFPAAGNGVGGEPPGMTPVYLEMGTRPADGRVAVVGAVPRTVVVGGAATAEVLLCDGAGLGVAYGDGRDRTCRPVGEDVRAPWDQLVLRVDSTTPGTTVVVRGVDLTYWTPWQRGTQHVGPVAEVRFPPR